MTHESNEILQRSLDSVETFRTRIIACVVFFFVTIALALFSLMRGAASRIGNAGEIKLLFAVSATQMIFVALCTVIVALYITRMTKTILRAIELASRKAQ